MKKVVRRLGVSMLEESSSPSVTLVIFAKKPIPGFAKTRLIPALGENGAAVLASRMLRHTIKEAYNAGMDEVELCVTPDESNIEELEVPLPGLMARTTQGSGDLGERLGRAGRRLDSPGRAILFIGTDCPDLTAEHLTAAARSLHSSDACMIPTFDGGYALIGFRRFNAHLFKDISWSSPHVAAQTRDRCRRLNWRLVELPTLHDIDEPSDLQWLPAGLQN